MAVCIVKQARLDASGMASLDCVDAEEDITNVEHWPNDCRRYRDATYGEQIATPLAIALWKEECEAIRSMGVYIHLSIAQCLTATGRRRGDSMGRHQ